MTGRTVAPPEPVASGGDALHAEPLQCWQGAPAEQWAARWGVPAVRLFRSVCSTNNVARALAADGAAHATVVIAEEQLRGRGQRGREWSSAAGLGLWMTLILRPPSADWQVAPLPILAGLAAARALGKSGGVPVAVKWPNDLLLNGRKVGGVLCEGSWHGARLKEAVVGIGLNLHHTEAQFPPELRQTATSLQQASGAAPATGRVAGRIVRGLVAALSVPRLSLAGGWMREMQHRDFLRGRHVVVHPVGAGAAATHGIAAGVTAEGALIIHDRTGRRVLVESGTVRLAVGTEAEELPPAAARPCA